ncbi:TRAP transporter small permease [Desulfotignum balticum]|jgi:TRAP-type C4-dicarboxylate transport system permease small subunit|uniref:TRAP transporter small permease n=1 Tax=Desulfotignum balticum TaxID=115781 RepID=UPI000403D07F|nr:TRAP transporter small permease [Desulfotignum balticum]
MQITPIENNIHRVARLMYFFAGMAIVAMMMITTLDVFMRFCVTMYSKFGWEFLASWRPVPGTYDLVAMCGAIAAAFAMAHTTLESGHVAVSLVVRLLSKKGQLWMKMFTDTASLSLFSILAWRSVVYAGKLKESGEVSMTMQLPYHPFVYLMAFSSLVVALVYLIAIIKNMKKVVSL